MMNIESTRLSGQAVPRYAKVIPFGGNSGTLISQALDRFEKNLGTPSTAQAGGLSETTTGDILARIERMSDVVSEFIYNDQLTGIKNVRSYNRDKVNLFVESCKNNTPFGYIEFDLDNFGNYNNVYGHNEGDKALQAFARIVEGVLKSEGTLYRRGGEEFVALMPDVTPARLAEITEKIRIAIEGRTKKLKAEGDLPESFTVSQGYKIFNPPEDAQQIAETFAAKAKGDVEAGLKFREYFKDHFISLENSVDDALYYSKLYRGRNASTGADELKPEVLQALQVKKEIAALIRKNGTDLTKLLVGLLTGQQNPKSSP